MKSWSCIATVLMLTLAGMSSAAAQVGTTSGSSDRASLSGFRGDSIETLELSRNKGVIAISGERNAMGTCRIKIEGKRLAMNADFETRQAGNCSPSVGKAFSVDARYGDYITALRVCTTRGPHHMVTGMEIQSRGISKSGAMEDFAPSDRDWSEHCNRWQSWSSCPTGKVMVGIEIHFKDAPADYRWANGYVTGIAALCQEITVKP